MSRNLPRKRHLHPHNDTELNRVQAATATLLNAKHVRWLQKGLFRRTRLLFSLLRRYPVVLLLLFLLVWIGLRLLAKINHKSLPSRSNHQFQHQVVELPRVSFADDQLIEEFHYGQLQRLSNFRDMPHGVFMDVQLEGTSKGIVKLFTEQTSRNASHAKRIPRLHLLAKVLRLHHGFMRSYEIRLPIPPQEPLADRRLAKALCRACGFRSPTKVMEGTTVAAYVVPVERGSLRMFSALRRPKIEPYEWEPNLPTSEECSRSNEDDGDSRTEQRRCRRLVEVMMVMYLGGCAPPENGAFAEWGGDGRGDEELKMAFPSGCFGGYEDNSILLDIVVAFVGKACALPSGLLGVMKGLVGVGWGVGKRAELLEKRLKLLNVDEGGTCGSRGWTFYPR